MKKNDKGFTFIEIVVVIVVIGIVAGISALSLGSLNSASAKNCSSQLNAYISKCRVASLSRAGEVYIKIKMQDGKVIGEYYEGGTLKETKTLSNGRAKVSYKVDEITSELSDGQELKLSFNRSTGALNPQTVGGEDYCTDIYITGGTKTYTISIVSATGKHSLS